MSEARPRAADNLPRMPLEEGHWRRSNTPLRRLTRRERNVVLAGLAVTVVALAALLLATAGDTQPAPGPGCIRVTVAGRTGGEPVHACGAEAIATCRQAARLDGPWAEAVSEGCAEASIRR